MKPNTPLAALLACLALPGCQDPYTQEASDGPSAGKPQARPRVEPPRGDELPPAPPRAEALPFRELAARDSPRGVLDAFCVQWANWTWRSIDRQQRRLARLASGDLAEQLLAQTRQANLDRALRRDRLAVRGRVIAVDLDPPGAPGRAVCITREQEIQNGRGDLGGGRHRVYLASVDRTRAGWGVSRWEPQP